MQNFLWTHLREPDFYFGSQVTCFWRDPYCHNKTPLYSFYKEAHSQKRYQNGLLSMLEESCEKNVQVSHPGALFWCGIWTQTSRTFCITPAALLGRLGLTADQRYDVPQDWIWEACVCWAWLGIPIFGSDFWDPHWKRNSHFIFDSKDSSRKIFLEFRCWKIEKSTFQFRNLEFQKKNKHRNSIHLISCMMSILIGQPVGFVMFIIWT